jgi:hypothetical protein
MGTNVVPAAGGRVGPDEAGRNVPGGGAGPIGVSVAYRASDQMSC